MQCHGDRVTARRPVVWTPLTPQITSYPLTMNALPAEIFADVFAQLPFRDHLAATHVCRSWREISHGHPALLWSTFRIGGGEIGSRILHDLLVRSQHPITSQWAPVNLQFFLQYVYSFRAVPTIAEHMHHFRNLSIQSGQGHPLGHDAALKIRAAVLLKPVPLLEHLELDFTQVFDGDELNLGEDPGSILFWVPDPDWRKLDSLGDEIVPSDSSAKFTLKPWLMIPAELFAGQAPRLQSLKLMGGFAMLHDCPALANLQTLSIELGAAGVTNETDRKAVLERSIESIARLPALQQLTLIIPAPFIMDFGVFAFKKPISRVLKEVHIIGAGDPTPLLRYLNYERVEALGTLIYSSWMDASEWRARGTPTTLQVTFQWDNTDDFEWRFVTADGRMWTLYSGPIEFVEIESQAIDYLSRSLTVLSVMASQLIHFSGFRFLQLQRLRIVSVIGIEWPAGGVIGVEGFTMECPTLSELEMICFGFSEEAQITTNDVVTFVNGHLGLSKDHLQRIDLWTTGDYGMEETAETLRAQYGTTVITMYTGIPKDIVAPRTFGSIAEAYTWPDLDPEEE